MNSAEQIKKQTEAYEFQLVEIDCAFERGDIDQKEAREWEARLVEQYPLAVK